MKTAKPKSNPQAGLPTGVHRWRFHLSALLLILPIAIAPSFLRNEALFYGDAGLGEREIGERAVGPWHLSIAEFLNEGPVNQGLAGNLKTFAVRQNPEDVDSIKAVYMKIGKPRSLRAAGVVMSGSPYRQLADVPIPERAKPSDELWLTVEGWDGSVHHAAIPLQEASPATVAWLAKRGGSQ